MSLAPEHTGNSHPASHLRAMRKAERCHGNISMCVTLCHAF